MTCSFTRCEWLHRGVSPEWRWRREPSESEAGQAAGAPATTSLLELNQERGHAVPQVGSKRGFVIDLAEVRTERLRVHHSDDVECSHGVIQDGHVGAVKELKSYRWRMWNLHCLAKT